MNLDRKFYLFLLFFIALALSSHTINGIPGEDLETESWFFDGDSFLMNGYDFDVAIADQKVHITYGGGYYLLETGECSSEEITKICLVQLQDDPDREKKKAELKIYTISPVIEIDREPDEGSIAVGMTSAISVDITNTGLKKAEEIVYEDVVPEELSIVGADNDLEIEGNKVIWKGELEKGTKEEFEYQVRGKNTGTASYQATALYDDGFTVRETISPAMTVNVGNPLSVTITSNRTSAYVGETIDLDINLLNQERDDVRVSNFEIFFPKNAEVVWFDQDMVKVDGRRYSWEGELGHNDSINFDVWVRPLFEGERDLIVRGTAIKNKESTDFRESLRLSTIKKDLIIKTLLMKPQNVKSSDPSGVVSRSSDDKEIEELHPGRFLVYVENPYDNVLLKNMSVSIDSDLINVSEITLDSLVKGSVKKIIDTSFTAPDIDRSSEKYETIIRAVFYSENGVSYTTEFKEDIVVESIEEIDVTKKLSTSNVEEGDEITVTVTVENKRSIDLEKIRVEEILNDSITTRGITSKMLDLDSGQEVDVYEYTARFPYIGKTHRYDIETNVSYVEDLGTEGKINFSVSDVERLTVDKKSPDIEFEKEFSQDSAVIGEIVRPSYTLKNEDERVLKNLKLVFPYIEKSLYVDAYEYDIQQLENGKSLSLDEAEKIIFLENKTKKITIPPTTIEFEDSFGNKYSDETGKKSIKVEHSEYQMAALNISRALVETETEENRTETWIYVTNMGKEATGFKLYDGSLTDQDNIRPGETKKYLSVVHREKYGVQEIPSAVAEFSVEPHTYYALSEKQEIKFKKPEEKEETDDTDDEDRTIPSEEEQTSEDSADEEQEINKEKQGIINKIISFFRSLFSG